jgi:2-polyprenyl-6-hydroxyphenyl methylase/3-demethylubiquinone-9 3-methyltransferase
VTRDPNDKRFFDYYKTASASAETLERFRNIYETLIACARGDGAPAKLKVADVGCGAGTQSIMWAQEGHDVSGIDVNADLIALAKTRAADAGVAVSFQTGSADALPWRAGEFDVCIVPELLEHVANWEGCLDEMCRVVKPGGYVFVSTTNRLCPKQQEFSLPAYSWYPTWLKRKCLQLALTTKKHWVAYAEFPAVNWFSPAELAGELKRRGYSSLDRFDLIVRREPTGAKSAIAKVVASSGVLRQLGYIVTPYTMLVARNDGSMAA